MNVIFKIFLFIFFLFSIYEKSHAQVIFPDSEARAKQQVFISTGLEPAWVSTVGYTRLISKGNKNFDWYLGAGMKLPPLIVTGRAWRGSLITGARWKMNDHWKTSFLSGLYLARDKNRAATMTGVGLEVRAFPVHTGSKWGKGMDIGLQYTILTHIRHSAETSETFRGRYPGNENESDGPVNGWYGSTAQRLRLGFAATRKLGKKLTFLITAGGLLSLQKQGIVMGFSHAQFPFYAEGSFIYGW